MQLLQRLHNYIKMQIDEHLKCLLKQRITMNVNKWDMFWCRMPLSKEELKRIPIKHQVRPYLIYKVDKQKVWGYLSSSKFHHRISEKLQFFICGEDHNSAKNSIINIQKLYEIPVENILDYAFTLTLEERKQFKNAIKCIQNKKQSKKQLEITNPTVRPTAGDILYYNEYAYIVVAAYKNHYYVTQLSNDNDCFDHMDNIYHYHVDKMDFYTNFKRLEKFSYKIKVSKVGEINKNQKKDLKMVEEAIPMIMHKSKKKSDKKKKKEISNKNPFNPYKVGSVYENDHHSQYLCLYLNGKKAYGICLNKNVFKQIVCLPEIYKLKTTGKYNRTKMIRTLEKLMYLNNHHINDAYHKLITYH